MFIAQSSESTDSWLKTDVGDIVSKDNIDSYIPEFDTDSARVELEFLQSIQNKINETKGSWDDYNDNFKYGRKYLLDYAKSNNVLEASVDNVKEANQKAREAAIAHNAALKQQTLGAKAAAVGMKALSTALNIGASLLIIGGIKLVDGLITTKKEAEEALEKIGKIIENLTEK